MKTLREKQLCYCYNEPKGRNNLEGFNNGELYQVEVCEDKKGVYCRIYHSEEYCETCTLGIFKKYFKKVTAPLNVRTETNEELRITRVINPDSLYLHHRNEIDGVGTRGFKSMVVSE